MTLQLTKGVVWNSGVLYLNGKPVVTMDGYRVQYVDAENGSDDNAGLSQSAALATIGEALDRAQSGDTILVAPGTYAENLIVDTDYVQIVGLRSGYGRPDIVPAAGVALIIRAQGVRLERARFASADDDCVIVEGNGFEHNDCVFDGSLAANKAGIRFKGNATDDAFTASEGVTQESLIRGNAVGVIFDTGNAPGNGVGSTHNVIRRCRFIDNTVDIATKDTGGGTYSVQDATIEGCFFLDKNKAVYIDLTTANGGAAGDQTGIIADNFFAADAIAGTQVKMAGTGFAFVGNLGTAGLLDGSGLD